MPKVVKSKSKSPSRTVSKKNITTGGLKKSNKRKIKLISVSLLAIIVTVFFGYRLFTGNWIGADAEVPFNYNPYYERCNPSIRDKENFKISEGAADSNSNKDDGQCVKAIQRALNDCCGQGLVEDGRFGPLTKKAVTNFQKFFKDPTPDGVVDKDLWNGLDYIHSVQLIKNNGKPWKSPSEVWTEGQQLVTIPKPIPVDDNNPGGGEIAKPIPADDNNPGGGGSVGDNITDTISPSKPGKPSFKIDGPSDSNKIITLNWSASKDNVGVSKYFIYRNNSKIGESNKNSYVDRSQITPGIPYRYHVVAYDSADNNSDNSESVIVTLPRSTRVFPLSPGCYNSDDAIFIKVNCNRNQDNKCYLIALTNGSQVANVNREINCKDGKIADSEIRDIDDKEVTDSIIRQREISCAPDEQLRDGKCLPIPLKTCSSANNRITVDPIKYFTYDDAKKGCVRRSNPSIVFRCVNGFIVVGSAISSRCIESRRNNIGANGSAISLVTNLIYNVLEVNSTNDATKGFYNDKSNGFHQKNIGGKGDISSPILSCRDKQRKGFKIDTNGNIRYSCVKTQR